MPVFRVQAFAFVEVFAEARTCACNIQDFITVQTMEEIFVKASASAYAAACVSTIPLTTYPTRVFADTMLRHS